MPTPKDGEKQSDFIGRAVKQIMGEGKTQEQALGEAYGLWRERKKKRAGYRVKRVLFNDLVGKDSNRITSDLGDDRAWQRALFNDDTFANQAEPVPNVDDDEGDDDAMDDAEGDDLSDELDFDQYELRDHADVRAKLFDDVLKDATAQSGHITTALGNERDRKRRELLSTMAEEPSKDDEHKTSVVNDLDKSWKLPLKIMKADADQRLIFGWASVVEKNGEPVIDKQGDIIPVAELERAAYEYVLHSRDGGDMHERRGVSRLVASLVTTPDIQKAFGFEVDQVGWIVGFYIDDDALWDAHKRGERPEFSIGGAAMPVEVEVYGKRARVRRHARRPF